MRFKHHKEEREKTDAAASQPPEQQSAAEAAEKVCRIWSNDQGVHLTCRYDDVAVPEVATGMVEQCEELEDEPCFICYDTAIPEVHMPSGILNCPAVSGDNQG